MSPVAVPAAVPGDPRTVPDAVQRIATPPTDAGADLPRRVVTDLIPSREAVLEVLAGYPTPLARARAAAGLLKELAPLVDAVITARGVAALETGLSDRALGAALGIGHGTAGDLLRKAAGRARRQSRRSLRPPKEAAERRGVAEVAGTTGTEEVTGDSTGLAQRSG